MDSITMRAGLAASIKVSRIRDQTTSFQLYYRSAETNYLWSALGPVRNPPEGVEVQLADINGALFARNQDWYIGLDHATINYGGPVGPATVNIVNPAPNHGQIAQFVLVDGANANTFVFVTVP